MFFYKNLVFLRKLKGLTQTKLAELLSVKQANINNWEHNKNYPNIDKLMEISRFFSIKIDKLLTIDLSNEANRYVDYVDQNPEKRSVSDDESQRNEIPADIRNMSQAGHPYMPYQTDREFLKDKKASDYLPIAYQLLKDLRKQIEKIKEINNSEAIAALKTALEAEKRNRDLVEENNRLKDQLLSAKK